LNGHRDWVRDRRARTRLLIEYGGLLVKAGLPERVEDDRATLLGALLMIRDQLEGLGGDSPADLKARWRRRGLRAFDAGAADKAAAAQETSDQTERPIPAG
jgi:Conjugal transfer protein TraD